jgi:hypothetical protein
MLILGTSTKVQAQDQFVIMNQIFVNIISYSCIGGRTFPELLFVIILEV